MAYIYKDFVGRLGHMTK